MKRIALLLLFCSIGFVNGQESTFSIRNLEINSKNQDFGVTYFGDSSVVFASSRKTKTLQNRKWNYNNQPFLELFKGTITRTGDIYDIQSFSKNINSKFHESNVAFTKDFKTVYFSRDNYIDSKKTVNEAGWVLIQLFKAEVNDAGEWFNIEKLPFNSDQYDSGHPALNQDDSKLYFTSNRPGTIGETDIFYVDILPDGTYGEPVNLGPNVNSVKKEMFPFVDDSNRLFYASNGKTNSLGGLDIYVVELTTNIPNGETLHLEYPINSEADDFGITYKKGKNIGYFSSNREGGKGDDDIYYFEQLQPLTFSCNQLLKGVVREKNSNALIPGTLVTLLNNGTKIESVIADSFGSFTFQIDCLTTYNISATKENYEDTTVSLVSENKNEGVVLKEVFLTPKEFVTARGKMMININPIYFDLDKWDINIEAAKELQKVVTILHKYPALKIDLGSHTDSRGDDNYNLLLSDKRAKASKNWLIENGIDGARISSKGYGETELINKCSNGVHCSEAEHQLNRRTEFVILNPEVIR